MFVNAARDDVGDLRLPSVKVPVLSNTIVSSRCASSSASASRIRIPAFAAAPVPTIDAVGVARPSEQGQAMTRTETALMIATGAIFVCAFRRAQ